MADHDIDALAVERDSLRAELAAAYRDRASSKSVLASVIAERDALKQRVAVLESQEFTLPHEPFRDPDRDLRERLICAVMTGLCADPTFDGNVVRSAIAFADEAIAEMRKGGGA